MHRPAANAPHARADDEAVDEPAEPMPESADEHAGEEGERVAATPPDRPVHVQHSQDPSSLLKNRS